MGELNQKQKLLLVAAFVVFVAFSIAMVVIALPTLKVDGLKDSLLNKNITVLTKNGSDTNQTKYGYGEQIAGSENSEISFDNNALIVLANDSLNIDSNKNITAGALVAYFNFQTPVSLTFDKTALQVDSNTTGIIDSKTKSIIILTGQTKVNGTIAKVNSQIQEVNDAFVIKSFDRGALTSNKDYKNLITAIGNFAAVPEELANINPPDFIELSPKTNLTTRNETLTITGQVPVQTKLTINDAAVLIDSSNTFSKEITLQIGTNRLSLKLTDKYENSATKEILVNRKVSNKSDCNNNEIEKDLVCLINNYRDDSNFDSAITNNDLHNLAFNHAQWMSDNTSTSSIESNGLSYKERCANVNLNCKYEVNLKLTENETAQEIFNNLISDTTNKQNILNSTQIGTGIVGDYLSILLI